MKQDKKRLGEMLIEAGLIDNLQLNAALGQQKQWGGKLGAKLVELGFVDERTIASVLEKQLGQRCIPLENIDIPQKALNAVKVDIAKKYCIMPLDLDKSTLSVAISDPTDMKTLDDIRFMLGVRIKPYLALESEIKTAIAQHYEGVAPLGKTYKASLEKTPETMQPLTTGAAVQPVEQTIDEMQIEHNMIFNPEELSEKSVEIEKPVEKKDTFSQALTEAIIALLIEKGIITKEELAKKIKEKTQKT